MTLNANGGTVHVSVISDQFGIVVPEPATYGMLGAGIGLLAFLRRHK
ncbi:MAG: PEP-CTERM sorting domain-containing protein [Acidobacteriota bacterium]|nr:PEP-CTERM sorting domain-containing protein [Acidobacteriota bacterium]